MKKSSVRIEKIILENFKNVCYGSIDFSNTRKNLQSSILGIYGQNGSGKTAMIDAISILRHVICGIQVPKKYGDYINIDAKFAKLCFIFSIKAKEEEFRVWYEFCIKKVINDNVDNRVNEETAYGTSKEEKELDYRVEVFDEILSFAYNGKGIKIRKNTLINTKTSAVFLPATKFIELVGDDKKSVTDLMVNKKYIKATSRSFIFSKEMMEIFREKSSNKLYCDLIERLADYGHRELFVINTENNSLIGMNALPLVFKYQEKESEAIGNIKLPLNAPALIPEGAYKYVIKVINDMNIVLEQIVPGLTIDVKDLGTFIDNNGNPGKRIQFLSLKNNKEIPLQYESDGIKKIISILHLLIVVYNNKSITVAIDELDAGIFEYLLGELLNIISEKGKGQLIFSSHNLRPLETIDKGFVAFTTTNPNNRYIRFKNVKGNNNLRDFYYRDIVLGEQDEEVYDPTNNSEIALAFRKAGDIFDS